MSLKTVRATLPQESFDLPEQVLSVFGYSPALFATLTPEQQSGILSNLFGNIPVLQWLLSHTGDIPQILNDWQVLTGQGSLGDKFKALQDLFGILQKDFQDFPGFTPTPAPSNGPIGPIGPQLATVSAQMQSIGDVNVIEAIGKILNDERFQALLDAIRAFTK